MTFEMRLHDSPFYQIKNGEKTVELRLFDEKRKKIAVGDVIIFSRRQNPVETVRASVIALHLHPSFSSLFATPLFQKCGLDELSPSEVEKEMRQYYSEADERKYGILGIEVKLI